MRVQPKSTPRGVGDVDDYVAARVIGGHMCS